MKKSILSGFFLFFTILAFAQSKGMEKGKNADLSMDQKAVLMTKKMQLGLDLNENQYEKLLKINKSYVAKRESLAPYLKEKGKDGPKLSSTEKFEHYDQRLDAKIAYQNEVKEILTESQFEQFKQSQRKMKKHHRKRRSFGGKGHKIKRSRR